MSTMIRRFVVAFACAVPLAAVAPSTEARATAPAHAPQPPAPPEAPFAPDAPMPPQPAVLPEHPFPPTFVLASAHRSTSKRVRIGVQVSSMTPELRKFLGAKKEVGILVQRVESDSAAARAGIEVGDVVVAVDGDAIDGIGEVAEALADRENGDKVDVVVVRKKKRRTLRVELQRNERDDEHGFAIGDVHVHGLPRTFSFGDGAGAEMERLRKLIEKLETRLESLEKRRERRVRRAVPGP